MPKTASEKRYLAPDPKYSSLLVTRFVNCLFAKGKKSVGERIFYEALNLVEERSGNSGLEV